MTDNRDICERLEDHRIDGAMSMRRDAAKEIRYLRYYVARLENDLVEEERQHGGKIVKLEDAREHISDQAIDIVTLGQEVGRLREALEDARNNGLIYWEPRTERGHVSKAQMLSRIDAALAEQEPK